jgi:hypothetical protein
VSVLLVLALLVLRFIRDTRYPFPQGQLEFFRASQRFNIAWYLIPHFNYSYRYAKEIFSEAQDAISGPNVQRIRTCPGHLSFRHFVKENVLVYTIEYFVGHAYVCLNMSFFPNCLVRFPPTLLHKFYLLVLKPYLSF